MEYKKCETCGVGFKPRYGAVDCPKCKEGVFEPKLRYDIIDQVYDATALPFGANH